jgi:germacradienol/geosmin synthase
MPYTARINPNADQARRSIVDWCREMGMLETLPEVPGASIWTEELLAQFDFGACSARIHPDATAPELDLSTAWAAWVTYADDYFPRIYGTRRDMVGAKAFEARMSCFMPLDCASMPPPTNPVEAGLADLWLRTATPMSLADRKQCRDAVGSVTGAWVWELQNHIQQRIPDPVDYIEMRRRTFGAELVMRLARIAVGDRLPAELFQTRPMLGLQNAAEDYDCLLNDIFSYQKEIQYEGDLHNYVLVVQNFLGIEPEQAVHVVNDLITSRVKQFEHIIATELPFVADSFELDDAGRKTLDDWVTMMQDWMAGMLEWHQLTGRNKAEHIRRMYAPSAHVEVEPSTAFAAGPTGVGTSAARVVSRLRAAPAGSGAL